MKKKRKIGKKRKKNKRKEKDPGKFSVKAIA